MFAKLLYDGGIIHVPKEMGNARPDQLNGSPFDMLVELAGRVCYDSLGTGRDSVQYHAHLVESGHTSVHEHAHFTVEVPMKNPRILLELMNRPDLWVTMDFKRDVLRVTINLRHLFDWFTMPAVMGSFFYDVFMHHAILLAPNVFRNCEWSCGVAAMPFLSDTKVVTPAYDTEKFITVYGECSRVCSHEWVRHRANISQRSSRYCDESEQPYVTHPLFSMLCADDLAEETHQHWKRSRELYSAVVADLQPKIAGDSARKQARSAARYYLGNGLGTAMIFTASVWHWRKIFAQRLNPAADAEIRTVMGSLLTDLQESRYAADFTDLSIKSTPTGPILE